MKEAADIRKRPVPSEPRDEHMSSRQLEAMRASMARRSIADEYAPAVVDEWTFQQFKSLVGKRLDQDGVFYTPADLQTDCRRAWTRAQAIQPGPGQGPGQGPGGWLRGAGGAPVELPAFGSGEAETYDLLQRHAAGHLDPAAVVLGPLPETATNSMRLVAADMGLLMGLRLAVDDPRPLPYSTRFCAWRMGWQLASGDFDKARASRVLRQLRDARVVEWVDSLPKTDTRLYAPPG